MVDIRKDTLKKMVQAIAATRSEEYDCELCYEQLEKFVEMDLVGADAAEAYPLVKHHLDSCVGCSEEYDALIDALNSMEAPIT